MNEINQWMNVLAHTLMWFQCARRALVPRQLGFLGGGVKFLNLDNPVIQ